MLAGALLGQLGIPQVLFAIVFLAMFVAFVATVILGVGFTIDSLTWYAKALEFWNSYVIQPAGGLAAWLPIDAVGNILSWWYLFLGGLFAIRSARFVMGVLTGSG